MLLQVWQFRTKLIRDRVSNVLAEDRLLEMLRNVLYCSWAKERVCLAKLLRRRVSGYFTEALITVHDGLSEFRMYGVESKMNEGVTLNLHVLHGSERPSFPGSHVESWEGRNHSGSDERKERRCSHSEIHPQASL